MNGNCVGRNNESFGQYALDILVWSFLFAAGILIAMLVIGYLYGDRMGMHCDNHGKIFGAVIILLVLAWLLKWLSCNYRCGSSSSYDGCERGSKCDKY